MSKELKKMSALVATGLAVGSMGLSDVHADSVETVNEVEIQATTEDPTVTLDQANQDLEQVQGEVVEAQATYENLDQQVTNTQEELSVVRTLTEDLSEQVSAIQEAITTTQAELEDAEQAFEVAQANYDQKLADNPSLASELKEAEDSYKEAEAKEKNITERVSNAQIETNNVEKALASAEKTVSETKSSIVTTTSSLSAVQSELSLSNEEFEATIANLSSTEVTVANRLKELEEAVENAGSDQVVSTRTLLVASVDGTERVEETKDSKHEQVLYAGTKTVEIELTPEQLAEYKETGHFTYEANNEAVAQYVVSMLKELRDLNGIDIPVPELSQAAMDYAQKRADEMNANKDLSHDTQYDTTNRVSENIGNITSSGLSYMSGAILSDEQAAYNLLLVYFADYINYYQDTYGHRITLLTASGDGLGSAFSGRYHVMDFMDYSGRTDTYEFSRQYWAILTEITYDEDNTMYYKGQRLTFLPKTTFNYVTKVTEILPNEEKQEAEQALSDYRSKSSTLLTNARTAVEQARNKVNQLSKQLEELSADLEQLEDRLPEQEQLVLTLQADLAEKSVQEETLLTDLEAVKEDVAYKRGVLVTILEKSEELIALRQALVEVENTTATLSEKITGLENKLATLLTSKATTEDAVGRLSELLTALELDRDEAKTVYESLITQLAEVQALVDNLSAKEIVSTVDEVKETVVQPTSEVSLGASATSQTSTTLSSQATSEVSIINAEKTANIVESKQEVSSGAKETNPTKESSLPNTGSKSSLMLMILGFLMTFFDWKKLKEQQQ